MGDGFARRAEANLLSYPPNMFVADLFKSSGDSYRLPQSWNKAGATYVNLANQHLKCDRKLEASRAYANAAHCYKLTDINESIYCFERAISTICDVGRFNVAGRYCQQLAQLHESGHNFEQSSLFYERAACFYENDDVSCAIECKLRIAELTRGRNRHEKADAVYEEIAELSLKSDKLKHKAREYLLRAGIGHLSNPDDAAFTTALERYQELDPAFSGTIEYKVLLDIAAFINSMKLEHKKAQGEEQISRSSVDIAARSKLKTAGMDKCKIDRVLNLVWYIN